MATEECPKTGIPLQVKETSEVPAGLAVKDPAIVTAVAQVAAVAWVQSLAWKTWPKKKKATREAPNWSSLAAQRVKELGLPLLWLHATVGAKKKRKK